MTTTVLHHGTCEAYDAIAPAYDVLTGSYAHDQWLVAIEEIAVAHGLSGNRLLDVACGTGKSFIPLHLRGYDVTACDISAPMLEIARRKAPGARLYQADMRALPRFGDFDLVTCLDDPLNYTLDEGELKAALMGIARNLADRGIAIWDLNTVAGYRGQFACDTIIAEDDLFIGWRGSHDLEVSSGGTVKVVLDVFASPDGDTWQRTSSVHRQRHWPRASVERVSRLAGMDVIDVRGQRPGVRIDHELDELVHTKAIYVARRRERRNP